MFEISIKANFHSQSSFDFRANILRTVGHRHSSIYWTTSHTKVLIDAFGQ
jgi:hypothetical protein